MHGGNLKLQKKFNDLYSLPKIIQVIILRKMIWVGHVARRGRNVYRVLVEKLEGKKPLGRPRHRLGG
jgi:hypothetical protein